MDFKKNEKNLYEEFKNSSRFRNEVNGLENFCHKDNTLNVEKEKGSAFLKKGFKKDVFGSADVMTFNGTKSKIVLLIGILLLSIVGSLFFISNFGADVVGPIMFGSVIIAAIAGLVTCFKPYRARELSIIYAIFEGIAIAGISYFTEVQYPGIVIPAVSLTIAVVLATTLIYNKLGSVSNKFVSIISVVTFAIAIGYGFMLVMALLGVPMSSMRTSGALGVIVSLVVVFVAASNLLIDYQFMNDAIEAGANKNMEWYAAFSVLVTIVWIYIEILDLLRKIKR